MKFKKNNGLGFFDKLAFESLYYMTEGGYLTWFGLVNLKKLPSKAFVVKNSAESETSSK